MIFEKRGQWCWRDGDGRLHKFDTEQEAMDASGGVFALEETFDAEEETEDFEEEAGTDE